MKLQRFEVESYMTLHENNCRYNLADTVAKSLTLKELLAYDKKRFIRRFNESFFRLWCY